MMDDKFYDEYKLCINHIREKLKDVYWHCENARTIESGNRLFAKYLKEFKDEAFRLVNSINKPYIVYRVNKYYDFLTN